MLCIRNNVLWHLVNTTVAFIPQFYCCKNDNFQIKMLDIFFFSKIKNIEIDGTR